MIHTCPVCGYDRLRHPPADYLICPCCGTEFGNDDLFESHAERRADWVLRGMPWFSRATLPPEGWDAARQMERVTE